MSDYSGQHPRNTQGDDDGPRVTCDAGELKVLLGRIADHIVEADTRHGSTLRDMHDRLVHLGEEAQAVRETVPPALAAAFARIEDGLADLASRIGEPDELPKHAHQDAAEYPCATHDAWDHSDVGGSANADYWGIKDSLTDRPSTVGSDGTHGRSQPANPSEQHWDRDSAEAFTRALEDGSDTGDHYQVSTGGRDAYQSEFTGSSTVGHTDASRRLDDVANRLEHALSAVWPNGSVADLETRFQTLEHRVGKALEGIATRADAEGLRLVEAQIADLAQHVQSTQDQFARLDAIEHHLAKVSETLTSERFANLLGNAPLTADDFDHLADVIAQRMQQQRSDNANVATIKLEELNGLVERFVTSYREADENTASALTTVQQAMVHLLDRFDPQAQPQQSWPDDSEPVSPEDDFDVRSDGEALLARVYHHQARDHHPRGAAAQAASPEPVEAPRTHASDLAEIAAELDEARTAARNAPAPMIGPTKPQVPQPMPTTGEAAPDTRRQLPGRREEFIASARRAARQASSQPPLSGEAAPQPEKRSWLSGRRKSLGRPTAGLFLATIVVLVAVGVGMTTYSFIKGGPAGAATPAHSLMIDESGAESSGAQFTTQPAASSSGNERPIDSNLIGDEPEAPPTNAPPALPAGVLIQTGSISAEELAQAQQRRAIAQTSTRLGAAQADIASIPTSLIPTDRERAGQGAAGGAMSASSQPQSLPPAAIGPLSLRIAAANGDPSAEFEVAARFAEGRGIQSDFTQAVTWYQRSASRGFAPAQYRLATLYEQGLGTTKDLARARVWYQSAAEKGNIKAMHNLAVLSAGRAPADYKTAAHWFTEAAERGVRDSQFNLAVLLESGYGVQADMAAAYRWFSIAAQAGDKEAPRRRDKIKSQLSLGDLQTADAALRSWRPKPIDHLVNDSRAAGEAWRRRENDPTAG